MRRTSPLLLLLSIGLLAWGCGHGDDVGKFVGSCGKSTDGSECIDYGDGWTLDAVKAECGTPGMSNWSGFTTTPCPAANRKTHCIFVEQPSGSPSDTFRESRYDDTNADYCNLNRGTLFSN